MIVILGSSRSDGHTFNAVQSVLEGYVPQHSLGDSYVSSSSLSFISLSPLSSSSLPLVVSLNTFNISPFDYSQQNQSDDYIPFMEKVVTFDRIILATPVYWYTMSAQMKIFIDRLSDLLSLRKDLGRSLKGKEVYVIASYGTSVPIGFEEAFQQTCDYMDMQYKGCSFIYSGEDKVLLDENITAICKAQAFINSKHPV